MKTKTSELIGAGLDWAVCESMEEGYFGSQSQPSTNWSQGGPLIAQYRMEISSHYSIGSYSAWIPPEDPCMDDAADFFAHGSGETHLIAACRAIVAANLGDEVELPEGLV